MRENLLRTFRPSTFFGDKKMPFGKRMLPEQADYSKRYTVLGLYHLNDHILLIKKKNGLYALPGGSSELDNPIQPALTNAGCKEDFLEGITTLLSKNFLSPPEQNIQREMLEETGILPTELEYFGHQKTLDYQDELTYLVKSGFLFDKQGSPVEITDFQQVTHRLWNFTPIGNSIHKITPCLALSLDEVIGNLNKVVWTHQTVLKHYLMELAKEDVALATKLNF